MSDISWEIRGTTFVCDADKRLEALKKHNLDFFHASTAFFDSNALIFYDAKHSIDEDRFILVGMAANAVLVFVVHTEHDDIYRIISARRAEKHEVKIYAEHAGILHAD